MIKVIVVIVLIAAIVGGIYMWNAHKQATKTSSVVPATTAPVAGGVSVPPISATGTILLKELVPNTTITIKAGWAVDGAFTNNLAPQTDCVSMSTCLGGSKYELIILQKIKKILYTHTADEGSIGSIQFQYMDNSLSPKYGTETGATFFKRDISSETGLRHIWNEKGKVGLLKYIIF